MALDILKYVVWTFIYLEMLLGLKICAGFMPYDAWPCKNYAAWTCNVLCRYLPLLMP